MCIYTCVFAVQTPAFYETEHFLLQLVDHFHVFLLHFMFRFVFLFTIYLFFIDVVSNPFLLSLFARYIFSWLFSFISSHFQVGVCFLHARSFIKKTGRHFRCVSSPRTRNTAEKYTPKRDRLAMRVRERAHNRRKKCGWFIPVAKVPLYWIR